MKTIAALLCGLFALSAQPVLAAADANACAEKSKQFKGAELDKFMKSCMEQVSSSANVKEKELAHKKAMCEQNAKNRKLEGGRRENYMAECLHKNEAASAAVAAQTAKPVVLFGTEKKEQPAAPASKPAAKHPKKAAPKPSSCAHQAAEKGLKGKELKKFISHCKDD